MNKYPPDGHILSKTTFIRGMQCQKSLYLNKYHPELRDEVSDDTRDILQRGIDIGVLARGIFPGGINCAPPVPGNYEESVKKTEYAITNGVEVIYEAAFIYDDVLCLLDILVKKNGRWRACEVKSSVRISDTYITDAALQYYVITGSGLELENFYIIYINSEYVRHGDIELNRLFISKSIKKLINKDQYNIKANIDMFKTVLSGNTTPDVDIGEHCTRPHVCDFRGHCWSHIREYSVFNIPQIGYKAFSLYRKGFVNIEDIPDDFPLNEAQKLQISCHRSGKPHIDREAIKLFLNSISYPIYFMDFETFMPAIPLFDNSRPYQFIPFQYSLHYMTDKNGELTHYEFLADTGTDPRLEFIERLIVDTLRIGDILVYNRGFETARLTELANMFPRYQHEIKEIISRIKDLMIPFQKKYYYTPEMKGRYSIKYVLPALISEMSYNGMKISHGREAMNAFESLQYETDKTKIAATREALLEYCKMDTFALVKLLGKLEETI
ncbi:MAG: DUF2779 domain-containing protein [Spirochaetes bacterium]|nr:DUF2779 domain-containing protein [Spirochaetota bacterium]